MLLLKSTSDFSVEFPISILELKSIAIYMQISSNVSRSAKTVDKTVKNNNKINTNQIPGSRVHRHCPDPQFGPWVWNQYFLFPFEGYQSWKGSHYIASKVIVWQRHLVEENNSNSHRSKFIKWCWNFNKFGLIEVLSKCVLLKFQ